MQVLVYKNESYAYFTKSEQEINSTVVKIEDIIKSIDDIKNKINGAKLILENIIKNPKVNSLNNDLKKLYLIIKTAIKDIEKIMKNFNIY